MTGAVPERSGWYRAGPRGLEWVAALDYEPAPDEATGLVRVEVEGPGLVQPMLDLDGPVL